MTDPTLNLATGKIQTDPPTEADPSSFAAGQITPHLLDVLERIASTLNHIASDTTSMAEEQASFNGRDSVWRAS